MLGQWYHVPRYESRPQQPVSINLTKIRPNFAKINFAFFDSNVKFATKALGCVDLQMSVSLLDYGAGNVRSVVNAVKKLGYQVDLIQNPTDIHKAKVICFFK